MKHRYDELPDDAELLKTLSHSDLQGFAKEVFAYRNTLKPLFLVITFMSIAILGATLAYGLTRGFTAGDWTDALQIPAALVTNFTLILVLHEGLHGLAYKLKGAKRVYFGAVLRKFTVYAASDEEIFDGNAFRLVAWLPFAVITPLLILGALLLPQYLVFFATAFAIHSFMCQGDFALILYMMQYPADKFLTKDSRAKEETYFYLIKGDTDNS